MNFLRFVWFVIPLALLCSACDAIIGSQSEVMPGSTLPTSQMKTKIRLEDPTVLLNSHKFGKSLALGIKNLSDSTFVFPKDFGTKIYTKEGVSWIEVPNLFGYPEGDNFLRTKEVVPSGILFHVEPYLQNYHAPVTIRIVVIGKLFDNPGESVGAFLDVVMRP
jgi:hypothetical protein